jgi:HK97 family phage major capsid protein
MSRLPIREIEERRSLNPLPHQELKAHGRYSLNRALGRLATGRPVDGIEGEVSEELRARWDLPSAPRGAMEGAPGCWVPMDAPLSERRALTTGAGAVVSPIIPEVIDVLRARLVCARLGARILDGLFGTPFIPRKTAATSLGWFSEGSAAPASNPQITETVQFEPHSTGAYVDFTRFARDLMIPSVRDTVIDDILAGLAVNIDAAAIAGTGSSNQPVGLLSNGSIPVVAFGTNGAAPTNALLVSMLETLLNNNGYDGVSLGFATSGSGVASLRTNPRNGTGSKMLLDGRDDFVLGCRVEATTNYPNTLTKGTGTGLSACTLGSWASLTIGLWPPYLQLNPFLQTTNGVVRITLFQDVDTQVRQVNQFVNVLDMVTP